MVVTSDTDLPSYEELETQELNLSSPALRAGAFHYGKYCENQNNEFMLCRQELDDPRRCIAEGKAVTNCAFNFFRLMKKHCREQFDEHANCLDKSSSDMQYNKCRNTQGAFDKCVFDKLNMERPEYGYFCRAKVHDSVRPPPEKKQPKVYPDATPGLPDDYPRVPAKYGSRFHWVE